MYDKPKNNGKGQEQNKTNMKEGWGGGRREEDCPTLTWCRGENPDSRPSGPRPSAAIAASPNAFDDIQVGERMKTVMLTPSTGCRLGTICIELEPFPMTPTRLFRKSYLDLISSHCPMKQIAPPPEGLYTYHLYIYHAH